MPQNDRESAYRYADALLALAQATGDLARMEAEVDALRDFLDGSEELRRFLGDPAILAKGKREAIEALLEDHISPPLRLFLMILLEEGHAHECRLVLARFFELVSAQKRQESATLTSARPVSPERIARIEEEVRRVMGKDINLRVLVEPGLLGGLVLRVGDLVLDGSVERQLDDMRRHLLT